MHYLSRVVGRPVRDGQGEPIGKVDDLIVAVGDRYPPVTGLVILAARRRIFLPWTAVESLDEHGVMLHTRTIDIGVFQQRPNEILLRKDLLDRQIVDIDGRRVVRVNDLRLDEVGGALHLVAVDVGAAGLVRRFGFEGPFRTIARGLRRPGAGALHRLGGRRPGRVVDRVGQAARAPQGPRRAASGGPGGHPRPARPARPGRRAGLARRRGRRGRHGGDGARGPGRGHRGPRAGAGRRHPRGDEPGRRRRPRGGPGPGHPRRDPGPHGARGGRGGPGAARLPGGQRRRHHDHAVHRARGAPDRRARPSTGCGSWSRTPRPSTTSTSPTTTAASPACSRCATSSWRIPRCPSRT